MYLTIESQNAFRAALSQITDEDIVRRDGRCTIGMALDLALCSADSSKYYLVHAPAHAELRFWRDNDASLYGKSSTEPTYARGRCTLFALDSSYQLMYYPDRIERQFVFKWLANQPLLEAGRTCVNRVAVLA